MQSEANPSLLKIPVNGEIYREFIDRLRQVWRIDTLSATFNLVKPHRDLPGQFAAEQGNYLGLKQGMISRLRFLTIREECAIVNKAGFLK